MQHLEDSTLYRMGLEHGLGAAEAISISSAIASMTSLTSVDLRYCMCAYACVLRACVCSCVCLYVCVCVWVCTLFARQTAGQMLQIDSMGGYLILRSGYHWEDGCARAPVGFRDCTCRRPFRFPPSLPRACAVTSASAS